ncbi:leucine-rich repeat protein [Porphyromonas endodontalis]|uniref:leucine-rich repeat protein n=1 Tax=Porphyromonas endodontalis TaxID=28124 RepID=UPI0028EA9B7C|nr:leucine-rich repeat protein [Porphyromonas endodontalis]
MKRLVLIFLFFFSGSTLLLNGQQLQNSPKYPQDMLPAQALEGSIKLQEITLPQSLKEIGSHAFRGCTQLKQIIITPGNPTKFNIDAFPDQEGLTLYVPTEEMLLALNAMFHFNKTRIEIGKPLALLPIQNEGILSIRTRENVLSLLPNSVGEIHIFDPQGLLLYQTKASANTALEIALPQGVYFVSFNNRITKVSL